MYFRNFPKVDYPIESSSETRKMVDLTAYTKVNLDRIDKVATYSYYNIEEGDRPENVSYALYGTPDYYWTFFLINPELRNYYDNWPKSSTSLISYCEEKYPDLAGLISSSEDLTGKFEIGEIVTGQQSLATGYIRRKYPTDGFIVIESISGTFKATGESLIGSATEDTITCSAITEEYNAPAWHINDLTQERTEQGVSGTTPYTFFEYERDLNLERGKIRVIKPDLIRELAAQFIEEMTSNV